MKRILIATGLVIFAFLLIVLVPFYKAAPVDPAWEAATDTAAHSGAVSVRFTGTSTLLFSDGKTQWMIDGWFSRPGPLRMLAGKIAPDMEAISAGLHANAVTTLAAVIPAHSHYDHAMDAPEVARRTGAVLMGSESTANIGRGWGLPESQIQVLKNLEPVKVGEFVITPIETGHFEFADPAIRARALEKPKIAEPLKPPVRMLDYRLGKAYTFHVSHPGGTFVVIASAGYRPGALAGMRADTVFLGVGGLGSQTADYRENYWIETVGTLAPKTVIPIHYDSLTGPIEGAFKGPVLIMSFLSSGLENTLPFLKAKEAQHPGLIFKILPRYHPVLVFE